MRPKNKILARKMYMQIDVKIKYGDGGQNNG